MRTQLKKWSIRIAATGGLLFGLLVLIVFNPSLSYAHKSKLESFTIYHSSPIDPSLSNVLQAAHQLIEQSQLYTPSFKLDICLNDGSFYPSVIRKVKGPAFAWGFYNKVVLQGEAEFANNTVSLNGYHWKASALLAHEMIHCFQYRALGLLHSNPIAQIPTWKWEGYAEYISRNGQAPSTLQERIALFQSIPEKQWSIEFKDGTITPQEYFQYMILVQYCIEIKRMSFTSLLNDETSEQDINSEMKQWFLSQKIN